MRVIIAANNLDVSEGIKTYLEQEYCIFDITQVNSKRGLTETLLKNPPDLLIINYHLIDGIVEDIIKQKGNYKIMLMTAYSPKIIRIDHLNVDCIMYMPFELNKFDECIKKLLK